MKKISLSLLTVFLLFAGGIFMLTKSGHQWKESHTISYDVANYYVFLPAVFIKHDLLLNFADKNKDSADYFAKKLYINTSPIGKKFTKMTIGMSIMYAPFFFTAHIIAGVFNYPQDGTSPPYQVLLNLAGLIYGFIGLLFLRKVLLHYFPEKVTAFTLVCIGAGTNLTYYTTFESAMSHAFSFCLFAVFFWLVIQWFSRPKFKFALLTGVCLTLIILVRATNGIIILLPLFYGITDLKTFRLKLLFLKSQLLNIIITGVICFLIMLPQFLYWHLVSGHYLFYAYGQESFFFKHPHFMDGLFGYRKGLFVYTPMVFLMVAGIIFVARRLPQYLLALILFLFANTWIILSWWCWWYGGSFGLRAFIESFVLLSIPLACLVEVCFKKIWSAIPLIVVASFLCFLNVFQTRQRNIHYDSMTKELYWKIFLNDQSPPDYWQLIKTPDYGKAWNGEWETDDKK